MLRKFITLCLVLMLNIGLSLANSNLEVWSDYMVKLGNALVMNWHPPKRPQSYKITVFFKIHKADGKFDDIRLQEPCKDKEACDAALFAVKQTGALKHNSLKELNQEFIDTEYSFTYNAKAKPPSGPSVTSD